MSARDPRTGRLEDQNAVPPSGLRKGGRNTRIAWATHRKQVRASNRARAAAERRLVDEFPMEFAELYGEELRLTDEQSLEKRIERLQAQLAELQGNTNNEEEEQS